MKIALYVIGGLFMVATLLPLIRYDHWVVRGFDFPHVQVTVINLLVLLGLVIFFPVSGWFHVSFLMVLSGCLLYQAYIIYPYTPIANTQVKRTVSPVDANSVGLMMANILMYNRDVENYLKRVEKVDPDILLMVETNEWWLKKIKPIRQKYPYCVEYPLENTYGMILYSKLELEDFDIKFLVKPDVPSFHGKVVLSSGQRVNLHCLHPEPPSPTESKTSTKRDAELLIVGKTMVNPTQPTLVAGDLNDVAWSYTTRLFIKISGLLDPRMGRGFYSTFHAKYPLMRWPLDHVFMSRHFKLVKIKRLLPYGSDHLPIYVEVTCENITGNEPIKTIIDHADEELVEEKIEQIRN
ncbi:MAG: endonuclease/exonuclease/phosphatase family protein [Bacteroidota bacterium]